MNHFVHPQGICESAKVGAGTSIRAFAHVLPRAVIGRDCNLSDHTFIENNVVIGDRVTISSNVHVCDGTTIEDDVYIGPNVSFANDRWPGSKEQRENGAILAEYNRKLDKQLKKMEALLPSCTDPEEKRCAENVIRMLKIDLGYITKKGNGKA